MKTILCAGAILIAAAGMTRAAGDADGWTLGLQAWTLNKKTFAEAVDESVKLGLTTIEAFPGQTLGGGIDGQMVYQMDPATQAKVLAMLQTKGVALVNYGVIRVKGETEWRKLFEFAKAMGIRTLVSEPDEADLDVISKLCDEFEINLAFHNHPQPSHYWNPDVVLAAVNGRSRRMGACADTGHWLRSGLDPIECLKKLEGRIISLHLKDLPEKGVKGAKDVPWGTGVANVDGILKELKRQGFKGQFSIEYENWIPTQMEEVATCVAWFRAWRGCAGCAPASAGMACATMSADCRDIWAKVPKTCPEDLWPAADPTGAVNVSKNATAKTPGAEAALDGDPAKAWTLKGKKGSLDLTVSGDAKIWFIGLVAAGDDRKADPKKIVVSGSKNGTDWTNLAEGKNLEFEKAGDVQHLMLKNPGAWPMIRVEVAGNNGAKTTLVGEIQLLAPAR